MKSLFIIMVSIVLMVPILFTVSSCEDNELQPGRDDGGTDGSEPIMQTRRSECTSNASDKCKDKECNNNTSYCGYYTGENEDNDTCSEVCKDLFTGDARDTCLEYKPEIIFDVKELVDLLERPTEDKLEDEVDKQTLCMLLKINPDPWVEEIEDYSSGRAEVVFRWVVDENISSYFTENDHQQDFMKQLFSSLGGEDKVTPDHILDGFMSDVEVDEDDDEQLPALFYLSENDGSKNSEAFQFVHELILVDKVCKNSNRPIANAANTSCTTSSCKYGKDGEAESKITVKKAEDAFNLQACILGVYCHVAGVDAREHEDGDDLRENVAHILNDGEVTDFIEAPVEEGGLGLDDDDDDADDWTDAACEELKNYWNDNSDLDLGLGS